MTIVLSRLLAKLGLYCFANETIKFFIPKFKDEFCSQTKVVHIYRKRKSGSGGYVGLNTSSDLCAEAMREYGIDAKSIGVIDSNGIDKVLFEERPSHLIVKAFWIPKEKLLLLAKKYRSCKFMIVCHSKPSFLGQEGNGLEKLIEYIKISKTQKNVFVCSNNPEVAHAFSKAYDAEVLWTPNLLPQVNVYFGDFPCRDRDALNIGLFCAIRPFKNILNQACAAVLVSKMLDLPLNLHIISDRLEMDGDRTLANLKIFFSYLGPDYKLVEHEWMEHDDFLSLVSSMDAGLQCSFTESFNIVSYDFLVSNVPVVVSYAVEWAPEEWKVNPDSIEEIRDKLYEVLTENKQKHIFRNLMGKRFLAQYSYDAIKQWYKLLANALKW